MRWKYPTPGDAHAEARKRALLGRIDDWWRIFAEHESTLHATFSRRMQFDIPTFMTQTLQPLAPNLAWEYGPALQTTGHRLVITAEDKPANRPLVDEIIARAPQLEGWEFHGYRPAEPSRVEELVRARTGGTAAGLTVEASVGEGGRIDLRFESPRAADRERALNEAFIATEHALGDERVDHWIGKIDVVSSAGWLRKTLGGGRQVPLHALQQAVEALIAQRRSALPEASFRERMRRGEVEGAVLKLKPSPATDAARQEDLIVATTFDLALWRESRGYRFYSGRHSRVGELFCYVKLDGSEGLDPDGFADRGEIEDALDDVLGQDGLGCPIGGGTGLRYSYVDLAIVDPDRALPRIVERLRQGRIPKRSWIQFFDRDLAAEWMGVYPDTPTPPGFGAA